MATPTPPRLDGTLGRPEAVGPIVELLDRLDAEQRAAALLPDGPAQIIAPAGSGKTTTLIARLGVLLARGVAAEQILVVTFNRAAAVELSTRIAVRLAPLANAAASIEVRTLHALARQVLIDAGLTVRLVADRLPLLRAARREAALRDGDAASVPVGPDVTLLDTALSAWKVEGRPPGPELRGPLDRYEVALHRRGLLDFDDLVVEAARRLEDEAALRARWQGRFAHVLVDEFQDVDAAQLRLVRILAAPEDNLFVVGDDDQTIYAWRLADVRRILDFSASYPDARRVMLATNYRCPPALVAASRRVIGHNAERFDKPIRPPLRPRGSGASRPAVLAMPSTGHDWPDRLVRLARHQVEIGGRVCFLARTRSELGHVALALLRAEVPHTTNLPSPLEAAPVVALVDDLRRQGGTDLAPFRALLALRAARGWNRGGTDDQIGDEDHHALDAAVGWAAGHTTVAAFLSAHDAARARLAALRVPGAPIELITVHGAKGCEWEVVVIVGFETDRFPNRRALLGAAEPVRALEEERRLAYVALTRATRQLVLAFDPARPSIFLAEMGATAPPRPPPS